MFDLKKKIGKEILKIKEPMDIPGNWFKGPF